MTTLTLERLDELAADASEALGEVDLDGTWGVGCPHGHPYDEANIYHRPSRPQDRECRACWKRKRLATALEARR